jgi:hypothetical protein
VANGGVEFVVVRFQTCRALDDREYLRWQRDLKAGVSDRLVFRFHERFEELTLPKGLEQHFGVVITSPRGNVLNGAQEPSGPCDNARAT